MIYESEHDYNRREVLALQAINDYFDPRPQYVSIAAQSVFEAGFDRGWRAAKKHIQVAQATPLTPPAPGEYWPGQGGHYITTVLPSHGLPQRHLITSKDEAEDLAYGPDINVPGATSQFDGPLNTAALLATGQEHPAAKWANRYIADGHTDFHLPSRHDLLMAYLCAPQLFNKEGWYWSSTQLSRYNASIQDFECGYSNWNVKDLGYRVRAFRWIPLTNLL